jgi:hypothetical protein
LFLLFVGEGLTVVFIFVDGVSCNSSNCKEPSCSFSALQNHIAKRECIEYQLFSFLNKTKQNKTVERQPLNKIGREKSVRTFPRPAEKNLFAFVFTFSMLYFGCKNAKIQSGQNRADGDGDYELRDLIDDERIRGSRNERHRRHD